MLTCTFVRCAVSFRSVHLAGNVQINLPPVQGAALSMTQIDLHVLDTMRRMMLHLPRISAAHTPAVELKAACSRADYRRDIALN